MMFCRSACLTHTLASRAVALVLIVSAMAGVVAADAAVAAPERPEVASREEPAGGKPGRTQMTGETAVDRLFGRLADTKDQTEGEGISRRIEEQWLRSGSPTADLLLRRAMAATLTGDQALGVELLDRVIAIRPDWAEAWSRRATLFALMGDDVRAVTDLRRALALEPRHYQALAALGVIFSNEEDGRNALKAWRKALELNPFQPELKQRVDRLAPDVDGRDL